MLVLPIPSLTQLIGYICPEVFVVQYFSCDRQLSAIFHCLSEYKRIIIFVAVLSKLCQVIDDKS